MRKELRNDRRDDGSTTPAPGTVSISQEVSDEALSHVEEKSLAQETPIPYRNLPPANSTVPDTEPDEHRSPLPSTDTEPLQTMHSAEDSCDGTEDDTELTSLQMQVKQIQQQLREVKAKQSQETKEVLQELNTSQGRGDSPQVHNATTTSRECPS